MLSSQGFEGFFVSGDRVIEMVHDVRRSHELGIHAVGRGHDVGCDGTGWGNATVVYWWEL